MRVQALASLGRSPSARSLRAARWAARAPRLILLVTASIFIVAGLRATFTPPATRLPTRTTAGTTAVSLSAEAFAEAYARAYLTWDGRHTETRDIELRRFAPRTLTADTGISLRPASRERALFTAVVADRPSSRGRQITVRAETTRGTTYLAVRVAEGAHGALSIASYPAIVGGPPLNTTIALESDDPVTDPALESTVRRALTNYLAGRRDGLSADLTPGAVAVVPAQPMAVRNVEQVSWLRLGRSTSVVLRATRPDGVELTLEYLLAVERRAGRWFVRSIDTEPAPQQKEQR